MHSHSFITVVCNMQLYLPSIQLSDQIPKKMFQYWHEIETEHVIYLNFLCIICVVIGSFMCSVLVMSLVNVLKTLLV